MYNIERIGKSIADIEKYLKEITSYNIKTLNNLEDGKTYHAASMVVFAILNRTIDLGGELITAEELGAPQTYQDIMPTLAKAGIINKEQAVKLNKLIRKRNVLAHFYEDIHEKELFETIKDIPLIKEFVESVRKRLKK